MKASTLSNYSNDSITLLATLIRFARIERKLTTTEVAEHAGTSRSLLQRIEKGDRLTLLPKSIRKKHRVDDNF